MTAPEFAAWVAFYRMHPFDDYSRFYRPAALISASMSGAEVGDLLDWLERKPPATAGFSDVDLSMMKAFGLKPPRKDSGLGSGQQPIDNGSRGLAAGNPTP